MSSTSFSIIKSLSDTKSEQNLSGLEINIRQAIDDDYQTICVNEHLCYEIPWSNKMLLQCMKGSYCCFVMLNRSEIIGHMIIQPVLDEIHLHNVCLLEEFRGRNFGKLWIDYLLQYARRQQAITILLEVRVSNITAMALYLKTGFRKIGLRKDYYQTAVGREDALVMKAQVESLTKVSD